MFYLTLRKRKLSPSGRLLKNSGHVRAIARNIGLCRLWAQQVYVPNGAVFQQSPRERRIRGEDYHRLMESAVAGRSDLIARTKAGLCAKAAANTNS